MSDAILKNVQTHLEALRRHNHHVNAAEVARVAGLGTRAVATDQLGLLARIGGAAGEAAEGVGEGAEGAGEAAGEGAAEGTSRGFGGGGAGGGREREKSSSGLGEAVGQLARSGAELAETVLHGEKGDLSEDEEVTQGASEQRANKTNAHARPSENEEEPTGRDDDDDSDREYKLRGGTIRQTDERTIRLQHVAGYDFSVPTATPSAPRVLPGPNEIAVGATPPPVPSGQGSPGHRTGIASGLDAIVNYRGPGGSGR